MTRLAAPLRLRNFRPPIADSPNRTSSRSERAVRRFNSELVNLASLPANVHDFLHREMAGPSASGQIIPQIHIFGPALILKSRNFAEQHWTMIDPRPTVEAPDDDPYLWLEEIEGERVLVWVDAQNAATLTRFGDGRFAADRDALAAIFDRHNNLPLIARRGTRVFNFWKDGVNPRGLWRAT